MEEMLKLIATKKQFEVIKAALDFYSRFGSGQLSIAISDVCFQNDEQFSSNLHNIISDDFERDITRLKMKVFGDGEKIMGIGSRELSEKFKIAHDISQSIRHGLAIIFDDKHPSCVDYHQPMKYSKEELPTFCTIGESGVEKNQT